jgi:spore germination protein GerM
VTRWPITLLSVATLTAVGAACGIPQDRSPVIVPGGVVSPAVAPVEGQPTSPEAQTEIFLLQAEHLVTVRRSTPRRGVVDVVNLLLQGATETEFDAGIRSAISPQTALRSARVEGDTAVVDLSGALVEVGGQEQILAVAQIVLTATTVPGVGQVRLLLEGQAVEVPRADGTLTSETLRASDYAGLVR